jgi:hypothetical protein
LNLSISLAHRNPYLYSHACSFSLFHHRDSDNNTTTITTPIARMLGLGNYASDSDEDAGAPVETHAPLISSTVNRSTSAGAIERTARDPLHMHIHMHVHSTPIHSQGSVNSVPTQPSGFKLNLASLLPAASNSSVGVAHEHEHEHEHGHEREQRKRRKAEKAEKRERKRQKQQADEDVVASKSTCRNDGDFDSFPLLAPIPTSIPTTAATTSIGLNSMLPPPKFSSQPPTRPSYSEYTPSTYQTNQSVSKDLTADIPHIPTKSATIPPALSVGSAVPLTAAPSPVTHRLPPGMRARPGMNSKLNPSISTSPSYVSVSPSAAPSVPLSSVHPPASYEEAMAAAAAVTAAAGLNDADDVNQQETNAALSMSPIPPQSHMASSHIDADADAPYIPLYARAAQHSRTVNTKLIDPLTNLTGQDKFVSSHILTHSICIPPLDKHLNHSQRALHLAYCDVCGYLRM